MGWLERVCRWLGGGRNLRKGEHAHWTSVFLHVKLTEQEAGDEEVVGSPGLGHVKGSRRGMRPEIPLPTLPRHPSALLWSPP